MMMHTNRSHTLLNYAQESERTKQDERKSETIIMLQEREEKEETKTTKKKLIDRMIQGKKC